VKTVAHEIAHQWFGDSVTESTWADLWLSEGFATYFAGLAIENLEGESQFESYLETSAKAVFAYEKQTVVPIHDIDTPELLKLLNANNYQKGAWVLHMLRMRLGDASFFEGIRRYYQAHKESTANTEDLRTALEQSSGKQLTDFFKRWVYESGHPKYELSSNWNAKRQSVELVLKQNQQSALFLDPVPVRLTSGSKSLDVKIVPTNKVTTATFHFDSQPTQIEIDPHNTLLKETKVVN
jgi:aminopeptidase N